MYPWQDCGGDPNDKCGRNDRMRVYEVYPRPWVNGPSKFSSDKQSFDKSFMYSPWWLNFSSIFNFDFKMTEKKISNL